MRIHDFVLGLATLAAIGLSSWGLVMLVDHNSKIKTIEDTYYTREDAANDRALLLKEMETPPKWVTDRLDLILTEMRTLQADVRELRESR